MTDLYRLVYTSRNLLAGPEEAHAAAVAEVLATSRRNNARVGVTGALLFNGGSFAQVLEGPRAAVEATFERIQRDARHSDVSVLQCEPVTERGFPHWSMSFIGHSARGRALWDDIASRTGFDLARIEGDALFATLHAIVTDEEGLPPAPPAPAVPPRRREPGRADGLDVARLRSELGTPAAAPAAPPRAEAPCPDAPDGIAVAVLRAALAEERERTSALRRDLDEARIALASASERAEAAARHLDLWAARTRALAAALCRDPADDEAAPDEPAQAGGAGRLRTAA